MKRLVLLLSFVTVIPLNGQSYLISFSGMGETPTLGSVTVENLTSGTTINLNGDDILQLSVITGDHGSVFEKSPGLLFYPNPMTEKSVIKLTAPSDGNAQFLVTDITGRQIFTEQLHLNHSPDDYTLTGLGKGLYLISVSGRGYRYSGVLICISPSAGSPRLFKRMDTNTELYGKDYEKAKGTTNTVNMDYIEGSMLRFTGISGTYKTIKTDIPTGDKTITFNFVSCNDGDNSYPVVEIGSQVWMAENLKTIRYGNGDLIGTTDPATLNITDITDPKFQWAYDGNESNVTDYGRLYTWYAITDTRSVCPAGWHIPSDSEWSSLIAYLGGGEVAGGKMKETGLTHWTAPNEGATNISGFSGLPGGYRLSNSSIFHGLKEFGVYACTESVTSGYWGEWLYYHYRSSALGDGYRNDGFSVRCIKD